jgi:lysophospholipase L1-like esterase
MKNKDKIARAIALSNSSQLTDIANELNQWINKNGIALGDSITYGQGGTAPSGTDQAGYVGIVKNKLKLATYSNKGIAGRPMANGSANGEGTNTTGKTVDYTNVDLVTIFAGTNDFKLNIAIGTQGAIGDTTFVNTTFYGAYRELIEYILSHKPTVKIVLITPIQRDNGGYDVNTTNTVSCKLIDYINAIKNIGQMYGIPVLDLYSQSGITKLTLNTLTVDGLHPNDGGYIRIGNLISKYIRDI